MAWRRWFCGFLLASGLMAGSAQAEPSRADNFLDRYTSTVQDVLLQGLRLVGVQYRWGGTSEQEGLDCSGFVHVVFRDGIGKLLPRTAKELSGIGQKVDVNGLRPGDLVFFNTMRRTFSHVGIYLGENQFLHAPSTGSEVRIENLDTDYWMRRFSGARRVIVE